MNITIENLTKHFGEKEALNIQRYDIHSGEIIGLLGNNGAGKTTLFRILLDLLHADTGTAVIHGNLPDGSYVSFDTAKNEEWKRYTGAFIDSGFLIDFLTPEEYFSFIGRVNNISPSAIAEQLSKFEGFMNGEVMGQNILIRNLSRGNQQKVGIVGAMLSNPKLLILDEPFNFLDPSSQLAMKYLLENYNKETGATIIISSHNLTHTFDICTRATLLEHGKIIKDYDKDYATLTTEIEEYFKWNAF